MKWLKQKIRNWVFSDDAVLTSSYDVKVAEPRQVESHGFTLRVYKASGGTVIESSMYDSIKDRHRNGLYVVTDDKDLGEEIGKIITMENLKS